MFSKKLTNSSIPLSQLASNKPIRILHVVGGMDRGGAETWLMHVLRQIDRDRFQMDFVTPTDQKYAYTDELQALGSRIFPCLSPEQPRLYGANFRRILREYGPYDVVQVHIHHFSGYVLWLAQQEGIKTRIIHSHIDTSSIELTASWPRKMYVALMKWLISKNATAGLATSRMAAADLFGAEWESDLRWRTLYCGVDLAPFAVPMQAADIRAELGIPTDAIVVGHVGRFESQKNHQFLIEIAAEIAKTEPKMRLVLVGIGSLRDSIEAKVIEMGLSAQVIFLGSRPDVPRLMKGLMDVFLFPSRYEGLGLVLIEAQAAGLSCIFSDIIPTEADVVQPLMIRVSLAKSATEWAEIVLNTVSTDPLTASPAIALELVGQSVFNIDVSVEELTQFYLNTINPATIKTH
jgi:glycosyltransferase involved in cell wall biosynthesis